MREEIMDKIKSLLPKNNNGEDSYIKNGWFENLTLDDNQKTNIINCINNCTSPYADNEDEKLKLIFKAFSLFKPSETRVLILGQDPYPSGKGTGFAFLLNQKVTGRDSLYYILKAINDKNDFTPKTFNDKNDIEHLKIDYENWVSNNKVLLLNTSLTYEKHPNYGKSYEVCNDSKNQRKKETDDIKLKHQNAWKPFILQIIIKLLTCDNNLVVLLWGIDAQLSFIEYINNIQIGKNIRIFSCYHPTPKNENNRKNLDEKLLFNKAAPEQFKACNEFLTKNGENEINWQKLLNIYKN